MAITRILLILAVSLLAGCSGQSLLDPAKFFGERERAEFGRVSDALAGKNAEYLIETAEPVNSGALSRDGAAAIFAELPPGDLLGQEMVGATKVMMLGASGHTDYTATYQYHFTGGWAVAIFGLRREGDDASPLKLIKLNVSRLSDDLKVINAFTFDHKTPAQFVFFGVMLAVTAFVLFTFVTVIRLRKVLKRPVVWGVVVLLGVTAVQMNWTSGLFRFAPLSGGLFGGAALRAGLVAPWILTIYFPLGAVLFWILKRLGRLKKKESTAAPPADPV